ncbi:hypothetical protein IMG5_106030 [Ichthyophthirius multifiliis]|uniref:Response regulatory domain-containing protein n=1 Tax=Ichthyophthirius multifiliis TaxID=5932 RepID=G0QT46_ICHMU|nr:hypothetical protein IMG5_106030 [Ichthyophthirius multifiliis]EGR31621.1 hypothetical protein IMG5_106030 [Ichthyophthirius multifiliis]|eukprot:XP_004035107.1 hypothetical protein IMG5_106030 [Ichthyophthirius multifiliis]
MEELSFDYNIFRNDVDEKKSNQKFQENLIRESNFIKFKNTEIVQKDLIIQYVANYKKGNQKTTVIQIITIYPVILLICRFIQINIQMNIQNQHQIQTNYCQIQQMIFQILINLYQFNTNFDKKYNEYETHLSAQFNVLLNLSPDKANEKSSLFYDYQKTSIQNLKHTNTEIQDGNNQICQCPQILIVDDNIFNIYALSKLLESYGFVTETATNGQNQSVIVACTAFVREEDKQNALRNGMDDYLNKPVQNIFQTIEFVQNTFQDQDSIISSISLFSL